MFLQRKNILKLWTFIIANKLWSPSKIPPTDAPDLNMCQCQPTFRLSPEYGPVLPDWEFFVGPGIGSNSDLKDNLPQK